jgi:flavin reductase (DIM6/NTAB) family NADH-FMN oxidoreductase RutF
MTARIPTLVLSLVTTLAATACGGSFPPPNDELSAAQTDIGRAESGGAPSVPEAKLHLQLATEDLQKAKDQVDKDNQRASSLVALARVEAQLALSLAKEAAAQAQAAQAAQDVQKAKGN